MATVLSGVESGRWAQRMRTGRRGGRRCTPISWSYRLDRYDQLIGVHRLPPRLPVRIRCAQRPDSTPESTVAIAERLQGSDAAAEEREGSSMDDQDIAREL